MTARYASEARPDCDRIDRGDMTESISFLAPPTRIEGVDTHVLFWHWLGTTWTIDDWLFPLPEHEGSGK